MGKQLQIWEDYLKQRDENAKALGGIWDVKDALTKEVYKEGALDAKTKRLMALAVGMRAGCEICIIGQTQFAIQAGATNEEIFETIGVATAMGGTPGMAEAGKVMELLKELGRL
jgi:AhpD family alkylhydroperoxidase